MERADIEQEVIATLADQLEMKKEEITPESRLNDDLGMDSLENVEAIYEMEKKFSIEVPDEKSEKVTKVSDIVDIVQELTSTSDPA